MKKILITGGTGFVGENLIKKLVARGHTVNVLSRKKDYIKDANVFWWRPSNQFADHKAFDRITDIIHLSGSNILKRAWDDKYKARLVKSRVDSLALLFDIVREKQIKPDSFISASAIGYYGSVIRNEVFNENTPIQKQDFVTDLCQKWEEKADLFSTITRVSKVRIGLVLGKGGMLKELKRQFILSPLGSGKQWMPWVSIDDLSRIFIHLLENQTLSGVYNATAPNPVTNKKFTRCLAKKLRKPLLPAVPSCVLKIMLGERAKLLLSGTRISSEKIRQTGFDFKDTDLEKTLDKYL